MRDAFSLRRCLVLDSNKTANAAVLLDRPVHQIGARPKRNVIRKQHHALTQCVMAFAALAVLLGQPLAAQFSPALEMTWTGLWGKMPWKDLTNAEEEGIPVRGPRGGPGRRAGPRSVLCASQDRGCASRAEGRDA